MKEKDLIRFLDAFERFLGRNEHWFQNPEEKMEQFEKDMNEWDQDFIKQIGGVEKIIKELEKRME
ncbi:hypothetical protein GWK91_01500 [Virgibacillus sp. MSP4-1]|uniref:hypothetical protein n=1 Tax=Virgibacillus sp. MSP4-1 TaxID=2700081 RepID=UPI0003A081CD|nr:hypothetical protein [Virgibacillus sp. MSP4-1]QHS21707.1 hypothetical protein GWK91_01500 [Virgibacillus sp. MSP4-1]